MPLFLFCTLYVFVCAVSVVAGVLPLLSLMRVPSFVFVSVYVLTFFSFVHALCAFPGSLYHRRAP